MGLINTFLKTRVEDAFLSYGTVVVLSSMVIIWLLPHVFHKSRTPQFPVINPSPIWDLFNWSSAISYGFRGRLSILEGITKYAGKPFILMTDYKPKIVLSPDYIDSINAEPALSFNAWMHDELLGRLEAFKIFDNQGDIATKLARINLTQNLAKFTQPLSTETAMILDEIWGSNPDWQERSVKEEVISIIGRLTALVFAGPELAHNKDWQRITADVTTNAMLGVFEVRMWPKLLQPLATKLMPHAIRTQRDYVLGTKLLKKVMDERQRQRNEAVANSSTPPIYNDAIEWAEQLQSKDQCVDPLRLQMGLALAAIHTSADLLTKTIYRLCEFPDIIKPLREEIETVIGATGWVKTSLYDLKLLDSVLKETQRIEPITATFMAREATNDVSLSGSILMKKGDICVVSSHDMIDPNIYTDPLTFDPWRFAKRRQDPQLQHKSHLVSTSLDHTGFSHGKHACPGRFFAANEIKIALAHMIMKYDFRVDDIEALRSIELGTHITARSANIQLRRRECSIDL